MVVMRIVIHVDGKFDNDAVYITMVAALIMMIMMLINTVKSQYKEI